MEQENKYPELAKFKEVNEKYLWIQDFLKEFLDLKGSDSQSIVATGVILCGLTM